MNNNYEIIGLINNIELDKDKIFEEIVEEYSRSIIRVCYLQVGNREESEDLAQDVLLKIYKNLKKFKGNSSLYTWIYRITINTCLTYIKKENKLIYEEINESLHSVDNVEDIIVLNYSKELIREALFNSPQNYRIPLYMYFFENKKISEIAEILEVNENTIKTRLRRGKEFIKRYCGGDVDE